MMHHNIDDLLERETRRALALKGANHTAWNTGGQYRGPRPDAQPPGTRPTLRWPDERDLIPASCWHCGAGRTNFEVDAPYGGDSTRGEVRCLVCSRVQVWLQDARTASTPYRNTTEIAASLCAVCGERPRRFRKTLCGACLYVRQRNMDRERQQAGTP